MSLSLPPSGALTAAAMRAAAALIEQAGAVGLLLVSCHGGHVTIHVGPHDADVAVRAGQVAALASLLGTSPYQYDGTAAPAAWLQAAGQAGGATIEVTTRLRVRPAPGRTGTLAQTPSGQRSVITAGQDLPAGWRWITDLDTAGR